MSNLTAAQRRFIENATLFAACRLVFENLQESGCPSTKLEDIAITTSGGTPNRSNPNYFGGQIPWLKSGELNDGLIEGTEEAITEEGLHNSSARIYPKGTLVIALYGATVGKTGILTIEAASNQAVCAVIPKTSDLNNIYLFWFLRYKRPEFLKLSFGGAQPNISQRFLREVHLPIPSIAIQNVIIKFLSIIERRQRGERSIPIPNLPPPLRELPRIISRIEELAAKIEEARGLRREASEEVDTLSATELSLSIDRLSERFEKKLLKDLILNAGYGTSIKCTAEKVESSFPVLRIPNVASEQINFSNLKYGILSDSELKRAMIRTGDILIVRTNGSIDLVGRCAVVKETIEPTAFASYLIRLHCDSNRIEPDYLQMILKHQRTQGHLFDLARTTAGQYNVSLGRLQSLKIPVAPIKEQRRIVDYLDNLQAKVDALKKLQQETAAELDALLPSVLDQALKGKL